MRFSFAVWITLSAVFFIPAPSAFANCEAGAYTIHTVAEYKKPQADRIFMLYRISESSKLDARLTALDTHSFVWTTGNRDPITIRYGSREECRLKSGWILDPKFNPDDPYSSENPYRLDLSSCKPLMEKFPRIGYLVFNKSKNTLSIPQELPIRLEVKEGVPSQLKSQAVKDARSRELHLFAQPAWNGQSTSDPKSRILPSRVIDDRVQSIEIGERTSAFRLLIVSLLLKQVGESYPTELLPSELKENPAATLEFPVIYFSHPKNPKPEFVGDGADCSYAKLEDSGIQGRKSFDRFRATRAFDLDLDGIVDILEINERFAYEIAPGKNPLVINYGQGC